eukprot:4932210-Pleurochrysis_carterae.AAC.3
MKLCTEQRIAAGLTRILHGRFQVSRNFDGVTFDEWGLHLPSAVSQQYVDFCYRAGTSRKSRQAFNVVASVDTELAESAYPLSFVGEPSWCQICAASCCLERSGQPCSRCRAPAIA